MMELSERRDVVFSFKGATCSLVLFILMCSVPNGISVPDFPGGGPPLVIRLDSRFWRIPEDDIVGSRVAHAKVDDESEPITYSLEPSMNMDGSHLFQIGKETGAVYLKESLLGKKGQEFYMYVSATKGKIKTKTEVRVKVIGSGKSPSSSNGNFPPGLGERPNSFPTHLWDPSSIYNSTVPVIKTSTSPPPSRGPDLLLPTNSEKTKPILVPIDSKNSSNTSNSTENSNTNANPTPVLNNNYPYEIPTRPIEDISNNQIDKHVSLLENNAKKNTNNTSSSTTDNNSDSGKNNNTAALYTIIPIVLLFGILPIIGAVLWIIKKRSMKLKKRHTKEIRKDSAANTNSNVTSVSGDDQPISGALSQWIKRAKSNRYESYNPDVPQVPNRWEFPRHHLQIGGILGEGCFGQVWKCEALNIDGKEGTTTVAVKTLKESAGERERSDLLSELAVMKMLDPHPNVVRLIGSCTEKDPIFLIMEYITLGKLQSYLRNSRDEHYYKNLHADSSSLSSKDLTSFALQIARGMEYLSSKGIIHRDLAARNILLDQDKVCKVADFGFARDVLLNHVYERKSDGRLPIRWMSPESLYDNIFTTKTDVWAFGITFWEIITLGSTPYPGFSAGEVMKKVNSGYRLEKPQHCRRELYNIMFYCWAHNADDRPTFSDLVNFLNRLLLSETDYIELERFPEHDYYNYNMPSLSGEKL